jgi:dTDP-4-amino-4,6-dideoxygalactose transaminase
MNAKNAKSKLPFLRPTLPPLNRVIEQYGTAYESGMITNANLVARFEAACAERLGVRHCVAVSSCTSGLLLVLRALDLDGEVILPSFTFFATGHAVLWNRLRPVFAECDPESWNIDPADVATRITERTRAIIGVHLYGNPCAVDSLTDLAERYKLRLIFDAAHAFGSASQGRQIGRFGDAEVFSFTPTKTLVCGEGGLVATNDAVLAHRIRAGRNYGDLGAYDPELLGLNARMPEFNAAMGLAGLKDLDVKIDRRNQIAEQYTEGLQNISGLTRPLVRAGDICSFKDYSIGVRQEGCGFTRDQLAASLFEENIETKKYFYPPLHQQKLYREHTASLPVTERISADVLSLPIYESMTEDDVERVLSAARAVAGEKQQR